MLSEPTCPLEEPRNRRAGLLQTLQMRPIAAELQRIAEILGSLLPPDIKGLSRRQTVERVVKLHGVKMLGVVGKPALLREIPGVEGSSPVGRVVARGPNAQLPPL